MSGLHQGRIRRIPRLDRRLSPLTVFTASVKQANSAAQGSGLPGAGRPGPPELALSPDRAGRLWLIAPLEAV